MSKNERGISILEELIALALIILALVIFLGGLSVGSAGVGVVHKRVSSENLARAGLEHVKSVPYEIGADAYEAAIAEVPVAVPGYSLVVATLTLETNLQLITITVKSGEQTAFVMEGYKRGP